MASHAGGPAEPGPGARRFAGPILMVAALVLLAVGVSQIVPLARGLLPGGGGTTVTHDLVVERMRAVAKLVTSETTVRDVVVYQNRRLGSTKRSLIVVTGRVLAGIDLDRGTEVKVNHDDRSIQVTLPRASVQGVEVTHLRTYDEQRGLWNPFRPADRDTIYQLAREQLVSSAGELGVARHAEESARRLLESLISAEGYTVNVVFQGQHAPPDPSADAR